MLAVKKYIEDLTGVSPETQSKVYATLLIVIILFLLRWLTVRIIWRRTENVQVRYNWQKTSSYITITLLIILIGRVWYQGFEAIGTFLGLLSAGLAIAFKDPLANIAGWLYIITQRPFVLSDRIEIGKDAGDVIDIRVFQFTILEIKNWVEADQSTGRIIHIPNKDIFNYSVANYTRGFEYVWHEIPVIVTFESDWEKAKDIIQNIASEITIDYREIVKEKIKQASSKFVIHYNKLTPIVYTKVVDIGVQLTARFLCQARSRRIREQDFWEKILHLFARHEDIDFAYPTTRFYDNIHEGKTAQNNIDKDTPKPTDQI